MKTNTSLTDVLTSHRLNNNLPNFLIKKPVSHLTGFFYFYPMAKQYRYNPALPFIRDDVQGNLCINGEYVFSDIRDKLPLERLLRWVSSPNPQKKDKQQDKFRPEIHINNNFAESPHDKIVWLGHSSFYIQMGDKRLLTDPVFQHLTPFMKRRHGLPCDIYQLKNIDYILLSHGHRDHLDIPTLKSILRHNPDCEVLCPLGFEPLLRKTGFRKIQEAAWWQQYNTAGLSISMLPAKHWNRRFLTDYNRTLWGSFSVQYQSQNLYFAGDTGYAHHFREINRYFPAFDVCLMPIGAYKPRYIMEWAHTSPEEAIQAFHELNGKTFIPMHYGTFDLSDEPASEPIQIVRKMHETQQLKGNLHILKVGEEYIWQ